MSEAERFDIYNERGELLGSQTRSEVHRQGLWHRTFQCWIYGSDSEGTYVLFQLRHPEKDTYPSLLDISCAGHLLSGESPDDGVRELQEELGVAARFDELLPCGVFTEEKWLPDGLIDREFCHLYAMERSQPLEAYRLQPEEVSGLFVLRLADVHRMLDGEAVTARGVLLQPDGTLDGVVRTLQPCDFVPHTPDCYTLLFEVLKKIGV